MSVELMNKGDDMVSDSTWEIAHVDQSTRPKQFIFVLMPFSESFRDIYELGIKESCREAGAYCERIDEQLFNESILERVYNQISKAHVIIADMTGRNPNVFYETGYAHALGKRVILLTQGAEDIPFDLKHYPHIVYEGRITTLKQELTKRVEWCVANPKGVIESVDIAVELLVNGHDLNTNPTVACEAIGQDAYVARLELPIHNTGTTILQPSSCSLGLIVPDPIWEALRSQIAYDYFTGIIDHTANRIDDNRAMIELPLIRSLLPDARETFIVNLAGKDEWEIETEVRLFTELGPRPFPFRVKCWLE